MILPLSIVVAALVGGMVLGQLTRRRSVWWVPVRSFAVAAVISTVVVALLPEAVAELGGWALPGLLVALAIPPVLSRIGGTLGHHGRSSHHWGAELAFAGFAVHQLVETLALGSYVGSLGREPPPWGLFVAVGAHTLPLTAIFVAEAISHSGHRAAWLRGALLLGATILGYGVGQSVGALYLGAHPWVSILVAGFLVHVVTHPHEPQGGRTWVTGWVDALAIVLGLWLPAGVGRFVAEISTDHGHAHEVQGMFIEHLQTTTAVSALPLLLAWGFTLLGIRSTRLRRVLDVVPAEAVALVAWWLGGAVALVYGIVAVLLAKVAGTDVAQSVVFHDDHRHRDRRVVSVVAWLLVGVLLAAISSMLSRSAAILLGAVAVGLAWPVVALAPLSGVLLVKGVPLGAVMAALLMAPFLGRRSFLDDLARSGNRTALVRRGVLLLLAVGAAWVGEQLLQRTGPAWIPWRDDPMVVGVSALGLFAVVFAVLIRGGLSPWIAALTGDHPHE